MILETVPRHTLAARYRTAYERLPPGIRMIGMQVWMPVFFVLLFVFCYLLAFHAPGFKDVPVALAGPAESMQPVAARLERDSHHAVAVTVVADEMAAEAQVLDGSYAAAYVPGNDDATLVIASASSYQLANLNKSLFESLAAQSGVRLTVRDLAPLPPWDSFGMTPFYLTLLCTITGYMMSTFVGTMGGGLEHWQRFALFGTSSVLLPGLALLLTRYVIGAFHGSFLLMWSIGAATSFAVGCVVNGLSYFAGRFVIAWALVIFVFANVPSSGGAYPPELVPQPFSWLHHVVSGTATTNLMRHAVYGVGPPPWKGWPLLACYAAAGVVLAVVGKPVARRRSDRRKAAGKPPSMMTVAQAAALIHGGYVRPLAPIARVEKNVAGISGGDGRCPSDRE